MLLILPVDLLIYIFLSVCIISQSANSFIRLIKYYFIIIKVYTNIQMAASGLHTWVCSGSTVVEGN